LRIVSVVGTKKSGKTTVVERLVPELRRRGLRVGTLKLIHHEAFTIHAEGRDTARHWEAGADFSLAIAPGETTLVRRSPGRHETLDEVRPLVPPGTDVLLCEGLVSGGEDVRTVLCAWTEQELRALLRELPPDANVVAASGAVAQGGGRVVGLVALDARTDPDVKRLAGLVMG
jgi:molybdopterin-guanine dinucleotide biosynthesis protein MobB